MIANLGNPLANTGDALGDTYSSIENLTGSAFDDTLRGTNASNVLIGGDGDDTLVGASGTDRLSGGAGADILDGGRNFDTVDYSTSSAGVNITITRDDINTASGGDAEGDTLIEVENIIGSHFDDVLHSNKNKVTINGLGGNDTIRGSTNFDRLIGGAGDDIIIGGGNGGPGDRAEFAGNIADFLIGLAANGDLRVADIRAEGSEGVDTLRDIPNLNFDDVDVRSSDVVNTSLTLGTNADDSFTALSEATQVVTFDGDDTIRVTPDQNVDGGAGFDTVVYNVARAEIIAQLNDAGSLAISDLSDFSTAELVDVEAVQLTDGTFTVQELVDTETAIFGTQDSEEIRGDLNSNQIIGLGGDDTIFAGRSDDSIIWNDGDGSDSVDGGAGFDTQSIFLSNDSNDAVSIVTDGQITTGTGTTSVPFQLDLTKVERLSVEGRGGDDTLDGSASTLDLQLSGGDGDDTLFAGAGNDVVDGGTGTDTLVLAGTRDAFDVQFSEGRLVLTSDAGGTDTVLNVEQFRFDDGDVSLFSLIDDFGVTPETAGRVEVNSTVTGAIDQPGDLDHIAMDLEAGVTYLIEYKGARTNSGTLLDPLLNGLFDPGGVFIEGTRNDDGGKGLESLLLFTATVTGTHFAELNEFGSNSTGTYTLQLLEQTNTPDDTANLLIGTEGADRLDGQQGDDIIFGQAGDDVFVFNAGDGNDQIEGGDGQDALFVDLGADETGADPRSDDRVILDFEGDGSDDLSSTSGTQSGSFDLGIGDVEFLGLRLGDGDDTVLVESGQIDPEDAVVVLEGGSGSDTLSFDGLTPSVFVQLDGGALTPVLDLLGSLNTPDAQAELQRFDTTSPVGLLRDLEDRDTVFAVEGTTLIGFENVIGTSNGDVIFGSSDANALFGEDGADLLHGGAGADELDGGDSTDTASYEGSDAGVTVFLSTQNAQRGGHAEGDRMTSIENLIGSDHNDRLVGSADNNRLDGGRGDDILKVKDTQSDNTLLGGAGDDRLEGGNGGADQLNGGTGNDILIGLQGVDTLSGGDDDDILLAGQGDDILSGDAGDDRLRGNRGSDTLDGGSGSDDLRGGGGNDDLQGGLIMTSCLVKTAKTSCPAARAMTA